MTVSHVRTTAFMITLAAMSLALAYFARHWLIEPADMIAVCDAGANTVLCTVRAWIIQCFVHRRIGFVALALAVVAYATGWRSIAAVALACACAGLVLYTAEPCAPAALLAVLVFVRHGGQALAQAKPHHSPQSTSA